MPSSSYDVVVLGDEFAGLVAATLCASRGLRVLILNSGETQSQYTIGEHKFTVEPAPILGLSTKPVRRVVDELHFQHSLRRKMTDIDPPVVLAGPDQRISLHSDPLQLGRELERELPDEDTEGFFRTAEETRESLEPLLSHDDPSGANFKERREFSKANSSLRKLEKAFNQQKTATASILSRVPAALTSRMLSNDASWVACAQVMNQWRAGAHRIEGDWDGLRSVFLGKYKSHNGDVRKADSYEVLQRWKRATGIRLLGGEEIAAEQVIAAMPIGELAASFPSRVPRQIRDLERSVELSGYRYTLNVVMDQRVVPEGMPPAVLMVVDVSKPLSGDNAIAIYRSPADGNGRVTLAIQATAEASRRTALPAQFASLRKKILSRLEDIMPFSANAIELIHSPNESSHAVGLKEEIGVTSAPPLWHSTAKTDFSLQALPMRIGLKNFSIASSQVFPALGFTGELMAAWSAAGAASAALLGKKRSSDASDM